MNTVANAASSAASDDVVPPFERIVCGVDGSRSGHEAARQAAALAAPGGVLELVAVADEWGTGLNAAAVLSRKRARRVLDQTANEIRRCCRGMHVESRIVDGRPPWQSLLHAAADSDLLVVARHRHSRFSGPLIGSTAANLVHRAHVPVLVAVAPPNGQRFPGRILVAADGPGHPERAVTLAGLIARDSGSDITLVRLDWTNRMRRPELAVAVASLNELGVEPVEILTGGIPRRQIPLLAAREKASLVVLGSRGLTGTRALSSVSERVAHDAPCSVLIVRPPLELASAVD